MNNEVKVKKHILCEKAPFLAMILGFLIASLVIGIPSALAGSSFVGQIVSCIAAVVFFECIMQSRVPYEKVKLQKE